MNQKEMEEYLILIEIVSNLAEAGNGLTYVIDPICMQLKNRLDILVKIEVLS